MTIEAVFRGLCPNCGGDIPASRLAEGLPCSECLPSKKALELMRDGYLRKLKIIEEKVRGIDEIFLKVINSRMWGLQRLWARRFFNNESFAMIAPTGSGKTTMQIILALYAAREGRRSLILVPTSLLASQVYSKTINIRDKLELNNVKVVAYHSLMTEKSKREAVNDVGEAFIIITTPASLMKKPELRQQINIAFIDDVDSFLRRSKSVEIVLRMLGVTEEDEDMVTKIQELESEARKLALENPEEARRLLDMAHKLRTSLQERAKGIIIVSGATQTARRTKRVRMLNT
ncbi:MAG: DEAD/DEAH box helicase, partial [Thermoprotei archaeon]